MICLAVGGGRCVPRDRQQLSRAQNSVEYSCPPTILWMNSCPSIQDNLSDGYEQQLMLMNKSLYETNAL